MDSVDSLFAFFSFEAKGKTLQNVINKLYFRYQDDVVSAYSSLRSIMLNRTAIHIKLVLPNDLEFEC
jgi:hypothetical protein